MKAIVIDFETRSKCPIEYGTDRYAADLSTDILCMAAVNLHDDKGWDWVPGEPFPAALAIAIEEAEYVIAHNARFDQSIWEYVAVGKYNFIELPPEKWYCSAAQCRVNALPSSLDKATRALGARHKKDHRGKALIRLLSIPNAEGEFNEDPDALKEMVDYCFDDVLATKDVVLGTRLMTAEEHRDWLISERINDRGVKIDLELATLAQQYAVVEQAAISEELTEITNGQITKHTQHQRIKEWVLLQCSDIEANEYKTLENLMTVYKKGEKKMSLDKSIRENILGLADAHELFLPDEVYDVIAAVDDGNKSSVAKFKRMIQMADPFDHRVRGAFMCFGAGQTKRFSSKGLQVHNFSRDCYKPEEAEDLLDEMRRGDEFDSVMEALKRALRPAMVPEEGNVFVVGDWAAIEGRCLPWLSGDPRAEAVLDVFRNDDDIYLHTAAAMQIDDRFIGKVATLALGYQGAVGAFNSMAKNYGLFLPEHKVKQIVKKWRGANQWAVDFWKALERGAIKAMRSPGKIITVGKVGYMFSPDIMGGTLFGLLPDNSFIQYPFAKLEYQESEYGGKHVITYLKASLNPAADAKEWPRHSLYGGIMAENFTQAMAAVLLRRTLRDVAACQLDCVLHVHDEIVLELLISQAENGKSELQKIMENVPEWAEGLPLKAVPEIMTRYGK